MALADVMKLSEDLKDLCPENLSSQRRDFLRLQKLLKARMCMTNAAGSNEHPTVCPPILVNYAALQITLGGRSQHHLVGVSSATMASRVMIFTRQNSSSVQQD